MNNCKLMLVFFSLIVLIISGCKKEFLDERPSKSLSTPETIDDFQRLLDNNAMFIGVGPKSLELACDDYYIDNSIFISLSYSDQNYYTWKSDTYAGGTGTGLADWTLPYSAILYANVCIDYMPNLKSINGSNQDNYNSVLGSAYFFRAFHFYNLAQVYAKPYNKSTSQTDLGIPLRTSSDLNFTFSRATVQETYEQIVSDLMMATKLLPKSIPTKSYINRPSLPAAYALLSRAYLMMSDFDKSSIYADSSLKYFNTITDYNSVVNTGTAPLLGASEVMIQSSTVVSSTISNARNTTYIDSALYNSYDVNDLRKSLFFAINTTNQRPYFKGTYFNTQSLQFCGFAASEMVLTSAECNARKGNLDLAASALDMLLVNRFKKGAYVKFTTNDKDVMLAKILSERRKEMLRRGVRWSDLRRLNQESKFAVTLKRTLNGVEYTLPPNDLRYALLIPLDEIALSGIQQNPR